MTIKVQKVLLWCGPLMLTLWLLSFVLLAGFIPPPSPEQSPQEVVDMFRDDTNVIRLGLVITLFASALLVPFAALISSQMKRIEGQRSALASTQLASAAVLSLEFIIPLMVWQTALYRPGHENARLVQMLNDMGWLMFVGVISSAVIQILAIGFVILVDERSTPVFPRWAGYFNFWVGLLLAPAGIVVFFKHGPFAWNGLFGFYIPLTAYCAWMFVMTYLLRRAINDESVNRAEDPAADSAVYRERCLSGCSVAYPESDRPQMRGDESTVRHAP